MKVNLLCSRHYLTKQFALLVDWLKERDRLGLVYLDPGAFTDWKKGRSRPVQEYADWLMEVGVPHDRYLAANVIGDNRQTLANLTWMTAQGYEPIPVWQPGMSASDVRYLYECANSFPHDNLVAMGGEPTKGWQAAAGRALNEDWLSTELGKKWGRPQVHILGLSDTRLLEKWRPVSADASSWGAGLRFGYCKSYVPGAMKMGSKVKRGQEPHKELVQFLDLLGISTTDMVPAAFDRNDGVSLAALITLCAHLWFVHDLKEQNVSRLFLSHHPSLYDLLTHPFDPIGKVEKALARL